jgi:hypothetical protein
MEHDVDIGYIMGVYLCVGQPIYNVHYSDAIHIQVLKNFAAVNEHINANSGKIFLFLGQGQHKIKRKAEQMACNEALGNIDI